MLKRSSSERRIGFLVNPIAGMGGRVGLKGTDGVAEEARRRGAKPVAPDRAWQFVASLLKNAPADMSVRWLTCPAPMGAETLKRARVPHEVLPVKTAKQTTAADTREAVHRFIEQQVDLIVFVGGDGTARDVLDALRNAKEVLVLGIPAGVKMYSGIFAFSPEAAAAVVASWVEGETQTEAFEVMDVDEQAVRADRLAIRLYGYLRGPLVPARMQGEKALTPDTMDEQENQEAAARTVVESMIPGDWYILGPGSTVREVARQLGVPKTLLGVDLYRSGRVIQDVNEERLVKEITDFLHAWIVVSPIGNQGILFGRGNQQISPAIIRRIPSEQLIVVATHSKVAGLAERGLHVDTGEPDVDRLLVGYTRVLVDYRTWRMMKVTT